MKKSRFIVFILGILCLIDFGYCKQDIILKTMKQELERNYKVLSRVKPVPLYFLEYELWDEYEKNITARLGAIYSEKEAKNMYADIDVRVGSPKLDNTHEIRSTSDAEFLDWLPQIVNVPIDKNPAALKTILWSETDKRFKQALEKYTKVTAEKRVKVAETDTSPDFSPARAQYYYTEDPEITIDFTAWRTQLKKLSKTFCNYPWIYSSYINLKTTLISRYIVTTDGSEIKENKLAYRIRIYGATMADDGMELYLIKTFFATTPKNLPDYNTLSRAIDTVIAHLDALRKAPVVEPYTGPAILVNEASGVFFHEIFGHRIEGHRQKSEFEGQTFTKKVGKQILPPFISVYEDPTMQSFEGTELNGFYHYDDEGIPAQRVTVVENGVLKNFLMSRSPIAGFMQSNGHGRRSYGRKVVSRQGVLYVKSDKEVPFEKLREALIEECKKNNKEYGLIFYDISGGFTSTGRSGTQTFKVIPLFVKRIYVDGRPDEVVRGVDVVGTPLLSFSKIELTGDDYKVFNGTCGAESGWVPVSSISPSIFVTEIEVEKKTKGQDKPPILPAPLKKYEQRRQ